MILLISTCAEKLHELEFVKPIEKILDEKKIKFFTKHYSKLTKPDLQKSNKIIICGTSLQDDNFLKNLKDFEFLKNYEKSILGICAGMQIISILFGGKIKRQTEIGFYREKFEKEFLGVGKNSEIEVYHLHNNYVMLPKNFEVCSESEDKIPQAIKHKTKNIYGILFHPEVRNKELIENFAIEQQ